MAGPRDDRREGAPSHIHIEKKKGFNCNWLPWLLLALSRCGRNERLRSRPPRHRLLLRQPLLRSSLRRQTRAKTSALVGTSELGSYLAGTHTFEKLNFDTAKSHTPPQTRSR